MRNITVTLKFQVIFAAHIPNPGITYQYTVTKRPPPPQQSYNWSLSDWSTCSTTCGGGLQTRRPLCLTPDGTSVETTYCPPDGQPESRIRKCHFEPCPTHWWVGPWQSCPVTCHNKVSKAHNLKTTFECFKVPKSHLFKYMKVGSST